MITTHKSGYAGEAKKSSQGISLSALVFCVLLSLLSGQAGATVIINDAFSDGSRSDRSLPGSAKWYLVGASSTASVNDGEFTISGPKGSAMTYFDPINLEVGQSLNLSFSYRFESTATTDNSFMFGLFNSGGSYLSEDNSSFSSNTFKDYTGYAASGVLGVDPSATGRAHMQARDGSGNNLLSLNTYTIGDTAVQSGAATPGEIYQATLQISRTASGMTVQSQIGSTNLVQTYTGALFTRFDTVGIFSSNANSFTLDNVQLDYVGAPEPSTFFALGFFGMAVCGKMLRRALRNVVLKLSPRPSAT